jgi:hypothetical protein
MVVLGFGRFAVALSVLLLVSLSMVANAAPMIETGQQLSAACAAYLKKTARESENILAKRDSCREYLSGFAAAYSTGKDTDLTSELEGISSGADAPSCFKFPDYLSFSDFARLVVDFVSTHPDYKSRPAFHTTAASLANKYPCR